MPNELVPHLTPDAIRRFWRYTQADGDCVVWLKSLNRGGYGQFSICVLEGKNVVALAHRVAWVIANGDIPDGLCICHRCDNRRCVNPAHLFLGTYKDNNRDMFAKGRGNRFDGSHVLGAANSRAKLVETDVVEIRRLRAAGVELKPIAQKFGVTTANISSIVGRKTWRHVA